MRRLYVLDGHTPVPCENVVDWQMWMFEESTNKERVVGWTDLPGDVQVSTVFVGMDYRFTGGGPPLVFETMVFRNGENVWMVRCASWEEAEAKHADVVEKAKKGLWTRGK